MPDARYIRLAKESSWILIGQIVTVLGSLVLVRVLTEHLDPKQYGQLALGLTVAGLVNQAVMGGITVGISRFYSIAAEKQDLHGYLRAVGGLMGYATLVVSAIGLVLIVGLVWLGYSQWMGLAAAALVLSVLNGYNSSLSGIQNAARQRQIVAFHGGLDAWLKMLLAVGVMIWLGNSAQAVVIGYVLSSLLVTGSQVFFLGSLISHQNTHSENGPRWMHQIWAYSWPFSVFGIFTWVHQSSDRWTLEVFTTTHEVGLYTVLFQLGYTPISIAMGLAMSFLGPILYQRSGDATDADRNVTVHRLAWHITLISLLVTLTGFAAALALHEWIFRILVASQYNSVSYLLPWVMLAGGLFATGQMLALKLMTDMKPAVMMKAKIITALMGIVLNIFFASIAGLEGIVAAQGAFSVTYLVWMVWLAFSSPAVVVEGR